MKKLVNISFRWGVIAAVLAISLVMTMFYLGRHPLMIAPFMDFRILLYGILTFVALKEFRQNHQQGVLYFWQGMLGSLVLVTVAGFLSSIFLWIFGTVEPDFVPDYIRLMSEYLKEFPPEDIERIGKEVYESNLNGLSSTNMAQLASLYLMQGFVIGLFVSIILSVTLRKQPKTN